jgi:hypothetical protein
VNIESIREQIKSLQDERDILESQPVNADGAAAIIDASFGPLRAEFARDCAMIQRVALAGDATHARNLMREQFQGLRLAALLLEVLGTEAFAGAFKVGLASVATTVLTPEQVQARLTEIGSDLDRLEAEEEALIDASELEGQPIARRPNARPEIILALQ